MKEGSGAVGLADEVELGYGFHLQFHVLQWTNIFVKNYMVVYTERRGLPSPTPRSARRNFRGGFSSNSRSEFLSRSLDGGNCQAGNGRL
jgi:hypothetical protein